MSNVASAIGLSSDNKLLPIGGQVSTPYLPDAGAQYAGGALNTWWDRNAISEDVTAPTTVASSEEGKILYWATTGENPVLVGAEGLLLFADGTITADEAGDVKTYVTPGVTIPAGCYLWVESVAADAIEYDEGNPIPDQTDIVVDVAYDYDIAPHFTGGPPPKVFEIFDGELPPGLALNSNGHITGTPTTLGASGNVIFKGRDGAGNSSNSNGVPFTVVPAIPASGVLLHFESGATTSDPENSGSESITFTRTGDWDQNVYSAKWGSRGCFSSSTGCHSSSDAYFNVGTGDFYYNFWYKQANGIAFNNRTVFCTNYGGGVGFIVYAGMPIVGADYRISVVDGASVRHSSPSQNATDNTQHFCALGRKDGVFYVQVDDAVVMSWADTTNYTGTAINLNSNAANSDTFNGGVDEFQFIKGYAPDFPVAVPTGPYTT